MLCLDDIKVEFESQGYKSTHMGISTDGTKSVLFMESTTQTSNIRCPKCDSPVHMHENTSLNIKDIPLIPGIAQSICCFCHRYICTKCSHTFTEAVPFMYPGTRITYRAANWIKSFLSNKLSIRAIQNITGIHWDTIRKIQLEIMNIALDERERELKEINHKPKYLAVDEFAIHKGHSYATCVMDLETGDILWVGQGRAMDDFEKFFENTEPDTLSEVIAVAMDMNASYNRLVEKYMPNAQIVYDRYHMQAQFGKDVLGVVRLEEARKHKDAAKEILADFKEETDKEIRSELKQKANSEKKQYSKLKKSRWTLLRNSQNLSDKSSEYLDEILQEHENLAVCYAMKEEMCRLFELQDYNQALEGWQKWFEAAKQSDIPALKHFAELKEKRIPGLAAHAVFPVSTGKLEGFNNKIKVAKRIGYGYRDENYFFMLIRYLSLPSVRSQSHIFP